MFSYQAVICNRAMANAGDVNPSASARDRFGGSSARRACPLCPLWL